MKNWLQRLWEKLFGNEPPCDHDWRPCVAVLHTWPQKRPARICSKCGAMNPLTEQQFFAEFGESFYSAMKRG